jgi:glycosyltransferase involved in cell wall biosynthesis
MDVNHQHILYLSYDGMTDPLGQSQVLPYLINLSKRGCKIDLISFEKSDRWDELSKEIDSLCEENNINWLPQTYLKNPPIISTFLDIKKMKKEAQRILSVTPNCIVHARSYIPGLVALGCKKNFGSKFLFDMRGFWADERVDGGIWNLKNPLYKFIYSWFKKKEIVLLKKSDHIISLTHKAKSEIINKFKLEESKISVIPCCADLDHFSSERLEKEKPVLTLPTKNKVVGYLGSIGTWYLLDEMLDYFLVYLKAEENSTFLFVTKEDPKIITKAAVSKGIQLDKILIVKATYAEVPSYLKLMDFLLCFIKPAYSKMASSPVKQGEAMAMGVPIICNAGVGDSDKLVTEYDSGILVDALSFEGYTKAIFKLKKWDKSEIRKGAEEYFSLTGGVDSYYNTYLELWKK